MVEKVEETKSKCQRKSKLGAKKSKFTKTIDPMSSDEETGDDATKKQ